MEQNQNPSTQRVALGALQGGVSPEQRLPEVLPGFNSLQGYELMVRQSKALSSSTLVPSAYRAVIIKKGRNNQPDTWDENASAIPNCMIALNMATRMRADPLMVMQNLIVVEGRPSWSSQWVIAQINNCGRFEPLNFDQHEVGEETVEMEYTEWSEGPGGRRVPTRKTKQVKVTNIECRAWTVKKGVVLPPGVATLQDAMALRIPVLKGPKVSVAMAVQEGWYTKTGSKWQTMPELMLHYRSGSFFGRLYAPELLMGIPSEDEVRDMGQLVSSADGSYSPAPAAQTSEPDPMNPSVESLRRSAQAQHESEQVVDTDHREAGNATNAAATGATQQGASSEPAATPAPSPSPSPTASPSPAVTTANQSSDDGNLFSQVD